MPENIKGMMEQFLSDKPKRTVAKEHIEADWLLVNCIDCRYPHAIHTYMLKYHEKEPYDHLVLAGASLAATEKHTHLQYWADTFAEHVSLSIKMHEIFGVLILNHRTCGAFREFKLLTSEEEKDPAFEFAKHKMVADDAVELVLNEFRKLKKEGYVHIYLAPVLNPGDTDFAIKPELLCKKRT